MPHVNFEPVDPNTTTRERFTNNILSIAIPSNASTDWGNAVRKQQALYKALYDHPAMEPNRQQTFMTPAAQKSRVYHLWDFVGRTLQFFYMVDYTKAFGRNVGKEKEIAADAYGRKIMSSILVFDNGPKSRMMLDFNTDIDVQFDESITSVADPL